MRWGNLPRLCYRESRSKIQHTKGSPDFLKVPVLCHARTGGGRALPCSHTPLEGPVSTVLPKAPCLSLTHPHNGHSLVLSLLCLHDWEHLCWTPGAVILHALVRTGVHKVPVSRLSTFLFSSCSNGPLRRAKEHTEFKWPQVSYPITSWNTETTAGKHL